jgi:hypothetical protein
VLIPSSHQEMPQTVMYIDTQSMWIWFYTATLKPVGKVFSGLTTQKSIGYGLNYKRTQLAEEGSSQGKSKGSYPAFEYNLFKRAPILGAITINTADKKVMLRYTVPQAELQAELERRGRRLAAKYLAARLPPGIAEKVMVSI